MITKLHTPQTKHFAQDVLHFYNFAAPPNKYAQCSHTILQMTPEFFKIVAGGLPKAMPKTSTRIDTTNADKYVLGAKMTKYGLPEWTESIMF